MNTKICTNIEQSKKLIELGINPKTADMYWLYIKTDGNKGRNNFYNYQCKVKDFMFNEYSDDVIQAWSLSALFNIMPRTISIRVDDRSANFYHLEWQFANDNSLRYIGSNRKTLIDIYSDHDSEYKDEIDTAVEMIIWLKENNYIK